MKRATVGYKSTDIGAIPADWQVSAVGDLFLVDPENLPASTSHLLKIKYIAISDVEHGRLRRYTRVFFGNAPLSARKKLRKGDVLISTVRPNLKSHYLLKSDEDCFVCSTGFSVLRARNSNALSEFFYHNLFAHCINLQIESALVGSTYPVIKSSDVKKLRIPLPKPSEQKAIATALSDVDGLIENIERLIAKKRDVKTAAMQVLLTGKKRLAGVNGDFRQVSLNEICEIQKGDLITKQTSVPGNIPVIAGGLTPSHYHNASNRPAHTITISASGANAGYVALHNKPIFASDCSTITPSEKYDVKFLYYSLKKNQLALHALQTGGAQPHVYPEHLRFFKITYVHDVNVQKTIASILSDMDAEIEALQKRLAKTKAIKIAMMQELLTGKTRLVKP